MKVLVPLADGFEEIEAVTVVDILRRATIDVTTVSLKEKQVTGSHGITITADKVIDEIDSGEYQCIVLPGGMPGSANLKASDRILGILKEISSHGGLTAAVCAAPIVLSAAGLLKGKTVTCYPGYENELAGAAATGNPVEADGTVITGKAAGCAAAFALKIVEKLISPGAADDVKKAIHL